MKKFINFRPFFILFLITICCVFASVELNTSVFYAFIFVLPIIFVVCLVLNKKLVFLSITLIVVSFVSLYSYFFVKNYTTKNYSNAYFVVYGTVSNISRANDKFYYLILNDAIGVDENGNELNLNGCLSLGVKDEYKNFSLRVEDKILFQTYLTSANFFKENGEVNTFAIKNNVKYYCDNVDFSSLTIYKGNLNLLESIKESNKNMLKEKFGEDMGELAFSILYGDRSNAPKELLEVFKASGVIHLFAVSGLHVGLIVALVYFLLKKLKASDIVNFVVCFVFLLLFCVVCSFAPSVVRASLMALTLLFSKLIYRKNDTLNSLSFSGVLLLLFNPLNLFDGGFQMSFFAVFGLLTLGSLLSKVKINNKILKYIFVLFSTTLGAEITLLPILAKFYSALPTWSLVSNLISIPIFSIFYPVLFIANLISLIFPFLSFLLYVPKGMLYVLLQINLFINNIPFSTIPVARLGLCFSLVFWFTEFFISHYNLLDKKVKIVGACFLLTLIIVLRFCLNLQF